MESHHSYVSERERFELKHLSRSRKRNQPEIPLVRSTENGGAQTELITIVVLKEVAISVV